MLRKALLIGAQTNGLTGVENDVTAIADALAEWDFEAVRREGPDATRGGILDAYEELIGNAGPDDAVLVYYSGHGGYIAPPRTGPESVSRFTAIDMQFIVPFDYGASTENDFRGITSVELSTLLDRLTNRTSNVVVALDCCHSAHMSRDLDLLARALPRPAPERFLATYKGILKHIAAQAAEKRSGWAPLGHANAVRVVACSAQQSAYEYTNQKQQRTGMLTESLVLALQEFEGLPVDWSTVMDRVRRRVLTSVPNQRPEVEGPAQRLLFRTATADAIGAVPAVWASGGRIRLEQAPLLTPVRVPGPDPRTAALVAAIVANATLRLAEPQELCPVQVRVDDAGFAVCDKAGPLHDPRPAGSEPEIVRNLERLARATALRTLTVDKRFALDQPVTVEWGLVGEGGTEQPLRLSGAVLHIGDRVYVRVRNEGPKVVHVSLIDIGIAADITLLTGFDPAGVALGEGEEYVLGADEFAGTLPGVPVTWPEHLDPTQARLETIQVLITSAPQNVGALRQTGVRGAALPGGSATKDKTSRSPTRSRPWAEPRS